MPKKFFIPFLGILLLGAGPALLLPSFAKGEPSTVEISFPSLWEDVRKNAPSEKAAEFQLQASVMEKERDLRLGYPRLYLDARAFSTNDPALSFFSVLNQRQIHPSDLAPDLLNNPGTQFFQKGTLGFDWPFYDGGARSSRLAAQEKIIQARSYEQKSGTIALYAESASLYGSVMILEEESDRLKKLLKSTENVIEHYRVGVKSNPLGYSGLLGLKSLKNKINGALIENSARMNSAKIALKEKAITLPSDWKPLPGEKGNILPFVQQFLPPPKDQKEITLSAQNLALQAEAEASEKMVEGEKAKERPRAGLFSEASLYNGNRDAASGYVFGVYLQWDLFSMERYKKPEQAKLSAFALKAKSDDLRLQEKIDRESALYAVSSLEKRIDLMTDNSKLLEEQTQTSHKLFLNGSINVLQLIDVFHQNLDVTINRTETEMEYLGVNTRRFRVSGLDIPFAAGGERNE